MELQEGAYENLITNELKQDIIEATDNGLVCKKDEIDGAESPSLLADHINKIIKNRLSDDSLSLEERVSFVNRLIDFLGENQDERIIESQKMLVSVISQQEEARLTATNKEIIRPLV